MKITCVAKSKGLIAAKLARLTELVRRLGQLRAEIWNEFGSMRGVNLTHRQIRDSWLLQKKAFNIPTRLWKETLRDVIDDIHLYCEAAKEKVRKAIPKHYKIKAEQKSAYSLLKSGKWGKDKYLRKSRLRARVKQLVTKAVHSVVDKAKVIVCEDLTPTIKSSKKIGKNQKRRLSGRVKGLLADALEQVSLRRGASVVPVNAAYTSQICSCCGCLSRRNADKFYCINNKCGVVLQADWNAAINIKLRKNHPEIGQWTAYTEVKSILLERSHQRLRFLSHNSRCHEEVFLKREYLRPLREQNA